jgi:hypothetical protein
MCLGTAALVEPVFPLAADRSHRMVGRRSETVLVPPYEIAGSERRADS